MFHHPRAWPVALTLLAACGGARGAQVAIGPPPAPATTASLAGPLCAAGACRCAEQPAEAGEPAPGVKRFEVRLGPSPWELWAALPGGVLFKSRERADGCFYVDLAPGKHAVTLRASHPSGVAAALAISELAPRANTAYETLRFSCGGSGAVCSFEDLAAQRARFAGGVAHDPCGSTKVRELSWDTGRSPDQLAPSELAVRLVLHVYRFTPDYPHGDPRCGRGDARGASTGAGDPAETAAEVAPPGSASRSGNLEHPSAARP
jgi:hypothetical protein